MVFLWVSLPAHFLLTKKKKREKKKKRTSLNPEAAAPPHLSLTPPPPHCSTYIQQSLLLASLSLPVRLCRRSQPQLGTTPPDWKCFLSVTTLDPPLGNLLRAAVDMAVPVSLQCLGLVTLAAILLQTVAAAVSFMYFNRVLSTVRHHLHPSSSSK